MTLQKASDTSFPIRAEGAWLCATKTGFSMNATRPPSLNEVASKADHQQDEWEMVGGIQTGGRPHAIGIPAQEVG
jgi:hypothetical protein